MNLSLQAQILRMWLARILADRLAAVGDSRILFHFNDWQMERPKELKQDFHQRLHEFEKGTPYAVSDFD